MAELTISALVENLFRARDMVAAEPTGFIQSVIVNGGSEGVSQNGTITSMRTTQPTLNTSYTPSMTIPEGDGQTIAADTMTLDKVANVRIPITGEIWKQLGNTVGDQYAIDQTIAQAIRTMRNAIEANAGIAIKNGSSRATGTAGTNPFATNINPLADLAQILTDNGCPMDSDLSCVFNTTAGTKFRQLTNLYKVNEAGDSNLLRRGEFGNIFGFSLKQSAGVASHTKGTGTSYQVNQTGLTNGSTTVTVDTGSGTVVAGDIITFASGTGSGYNYVVKTGIAAAGDLVLNYPGLRGNIADNNAITIGNNYTANMGFHKSAVEIAMRPPAQPYGGDAAVDRMTMYDEKSGLTFEVALYKGYGKVMLDLTCFYGIKVWKPEYVATLLG
jgi:hypothetical protein